MLKKCSSKGTHLSRQHFSGWHMSSKGSFWTLQQCSRLPNEILSSISLFFFYSLLQRDHMLSKHTFFFFFLFNNRGELYHPEQKSEAAVHPLCLVFIFMNCASCLLKWLTPSNSCKHTSHVCIHHADYFMYNNSSCVVEFFSICTSLKLCIMPVPAEHSSHEFHCMRYNFVFVHTRITAIF